MFFINFAKFFNYELIKMGLLQDKLAKYDEPQKYMAEGIYPYFREIEGKQGTGSSWEVIAYSCLVLTLIRSDGR